MTPLTAKISNEGAFFAASGKKPGYPLQFGRLLTQSSEFRFYPLRCRPA